jgi:hypothetical protein
MKRAKPRPAPKHRFVPCSLCADGLIIEDVHRNGEWIREGRRCGCLKAWLHAQKALILPMPERPRADLA